MLKLGTRCLQKVYNQNIKEKAWTAVEATRVSVLFYAWRGLQKPCSAPEFPTCRQMRIKLSTKKAIKRVDELCMLWHPWRQVVSFFVVVSRTLTTSSALKRHLSQTDYVEGFGNQQLNCIFVVSVLFFSAVMRRGTEKGEISLMQRNT